jgi:uncharacterized membrane protein HdeD (DUF308 family)
VKFAFGNQQTRESLFGGIVMSATTTAPTTLVKKALGWSIWLSVLMIVAGILAIVVPQAAGIGVAIFVGWLLVFSGGMHVVFGWHTRSSGVLLWELLRPSWRS